MDIYTAGMCLTAPPLTMGCGCSNSNHQITPSNGSSPDSTPQSAWRKNIINNGSLIANGINAATGSPENGNSAFLRSSERLIHQGVDTRSLNGAGVPWEGMGRNSSGLMCVSTAIQCNRRVDQKDACISTIESFSEKNPETDLGKANQATNFSANSAPVLAPLGSPLSLTSRNFSGPVYRCFSCTLLFSTENTFLPSPVLPTPPTMLCHSESSLELTRIQADIRRLTDVESVRDFLARSMMRMDLAVIGRQTQQCEPVDDAGVDSTGTSIPNVLAESDALVRRRVRRPLWSATERSGQPEDDERNNAEVPMLQGSISFRTRGRRKSDAAVQTDRAEAEVLDEVTMTENCPEFAPRPPACTKCQLVQNCDFGEIDEHSINTPSGAARTLHSLVNYLTVSCCDDLESVRAFYVWITHHIRYDLKYAAIKMSVAHILEVRSGVSKDYCKLFSEMCRLRDIRVKQIRGFSKGFNHRVGYQFKPNNEGTHIWNVVFLNATWRFVDCTFGTGFMNSLGQFHERFSEHFFLTDPEVFIWTHFPYNQPHDNYSNWQLLENPITLSEFNSRPKVTPHFFHYAVKIRTPSALQCPIVFSHSTELVLDTPQVQRYKYKLYPVDGVESGQLNRHVFCQLKGPARLLGSFQVTPPDDGDYLLKVYAHPEHDLNAEDTILSCVVVFLLRCTKTRKNVPVFPWNNIPWGITNYFLECGLKLVNLSSPILVVVSGRKILLMEKTEELLMTQQLSDVNGNEIAQKHAILKLESKDSVKFLVQPPSVGFFKLSIYACPRPNERGRWRLPCIATFLVDCKQTLWAAGELREQILNAKLKNLKH